MKDARSDEDSLLSHHPEDYAVYTLGSYDEETGKLDAHEPRHLYNLIDVNPHGVD